MNLLLVALVSVILATEFSIKPEVSEGNKKTEVIVNNLRNENN